MRAFPKTSHPNTINRPQLNAQYLDSLQRVSSLQRWNHSMEIVSDKRNHHTDNLSLNQTVHFQRFLSRSKNPKKPQCELQSNHWRLVTTILLQRFRVLQGLESNQVKITHILTMFFFFFFSFSFKKQNY
jgi:hypothetical protein